MTTVQDLLQTATKRLADAGITTARLDTLVLLEDVLGVDRALLLAHPERPIPKPQQDLLNTFITQRSTHKPLAYIRGRAPFFGRYFTVNEHVLVPRPESETIIEILLEGNLSERPHIADIGTGSGCLGITAALELPNADVDLIDIDRDALAVARANARSLGAHVRFRQQDLLSSTDTPAYDVLLANLPYVPDAYPINMAARHEPALALFAGDDGMECYRKFWRQLSGYGGKIPDYVLTESLDEQHAPMAALAGGAGYAVIDSRGLIQHFIRQDLAA
jgi:release factor glutamine methyltransferase